MTGSLMDEVDGALEHSNTASLSTLPSNQATGIIKIIQY